MNLFTLTVRMLRPLPGSSGYQIEQMPVSSPAAAIPGISSHDAEGGTLGSAVAISRSNAIPIPTATGAMARASRTNRYDSVG